MEYSAGYNAFNFVDAAVIVSSQVPCYQFGRANQHQLGGIWQQELTGREKTYVYGASSGLVEVEVQAVEGAVTTLLSLDGTRLIYRDMIDLIRDIYHDKAPTISGDSGAPLLVISNEKFYVAGMIVGGGGRPAKNRFPRSYAVPIRRILDCFNVEMHCKRRFTPTFRAAV